MLVVSPYVEWQLSSFFFGVGGLPAQHTDGKGILKGIRIFIRNKGIFLYYTSWISLSPCSSLQLRNFLNRSIFYICVGLSDCAKLKMYRLGMTRTKQQSVYAVTETYHCLICMVLNSLGGFILFYRDISKVEKVISKSWVTVDGRRFWILFLQLKGTSMALMEIPRLYWNHIC